MSDNTSPTSIGDLNDVKAQLEEALTRFELINKSSSEGLWDMVYPADGQIGPDTPFW